MKQNLSELILIAEDVFWTKGFKEYLKSLQISVLETFIIDSNYMTLLPQISQCLKIFQKDKYIIPIIFQGDLIILSSLVRLLKQSIPQIFPIIYFLSKSSESDSDSEGLKYFERILTSSECVTNLRNILDDARLHGCQSFSISGIPEFFTLVQGINLTPNEIKIIQLLSNGLTVPQIAEFKNVTDSTVYKALEKIEEKLNIRSLTQLVAIAFRSGLISQLEKKISDKV